MHQVEEHLHGGIFSGRVGAGGEGKGGIVLPDVDVGVDERNVGVCCATVTGQ